MRTTAKRLAVLLPLLAALSCARAEVESNGAYYPQEIRYRIEDVSEAYVAWGVNGWRHTEESSWNAKTFVNKNLLLTPLELVDGTLRTEINVPRGATIDFCFWVTKSTDGQVIDVWDPQAHHRKADAAGPVLVETTLGPGGLPNDALGARSRRNRLLAASSLLVVGGLLLARLRRRGQAPSYAQTIVLTAASLQGFLLLVRLHMQDGDVDGMAYAVPGLGASDLKYTLLLTAVFLLLGALLSTPNARRRLLWAFHAVALFSLAAAVVNIRVVETLGHPFNYRWLYYSDFLGSTEAQTAMVANYSWESAAAIVLLSAGVLLSARIALAMLGALRRVRFVQIGAYAALAAFCVATLMLAHSPRLAKVNPGAVANPVSAFVLSVVTADPQAGLFSLEVPDGFKRPPYAPPVDVHTPGTVTNVILVVLESAGARYFDLYGGKYGVSPRLNRAFEHALLFETAYTHAPSTNKSMVSILGSMYPMVSYKSLTQEMPDFAHPTLSSEFSRHGYRTAFFTSSNLSFQSSGKFLSNRAFDVIEDFDDVPCDKTFRLQGGNEGYNAGIDDACLGTRLTAWIDAEPDKPFFAMLWTNQGHYPYFSGTKERNFGVTDVYFNSYLNALHHYDEIIGAILDDLDTRGLTDSTLIAVVGDHGEAFGQHGENGHGSGVYEENVRVPFLLINPRLFSGTRRTEITGLIDLAPTLLGLAGKPLPEQWRGRSVFATDREQREFFFAPWSNFVFGLRDGDTKAIFDETRKRAELYDLANDPLEERNLAAEQPERVEALRYRIAAWVQEQKSRWVEK